jgi:dTDP-glucose 4,6-dehydratase
MKILLTGGTGFFGKALIRHWCNADDLDLPTPTVCVLSRSPNQFKDTYPEFKSRKWLYYHEGDILSPSSLPKEKYTHILHAATDSTLGPKLSSLERYVQILDGTRNMLDFAVANNTRRFLLTSSGAVYGVQPPELKRIPESYNGMPDPLNPNNSYGVAKRTAEHLCSLYRQHYGIETVIARCFAFVGRDLPLDVHFAIGNFIRDALLGQTIVVSGNGMSVRSYMDQRDLACWLDKLLVDGKSGKAYNVGSDESISIKNLAYLVRETLAPTAQIIIQTTAEQDVLRNQYVPKIDEAKNELGLKLNYTLAQSLKEVARFN